MSQSCDLCHFCAQNDRTWVLNGFFAGVAFTIAPHIVEQIPVPPRQVLIMKLYGSVKGFPFYRHFKTDQRRKPPQSLHWQCRCTDTSAAKPACAGLTL